MLQRIRQMIWRAPLYASSAVDKQECRDYGSATMIHENLSQSIESLSARMIAIRDSL